MFCPNCGTKNQDTATTCTSCGFALAKSGGASKFKGTMVMTAPSELQGSAAPAPAPTPGPGSAAPAPKQAFKGTMIGVAPPGLQHAPGTTPSTGGPAPAPTPAGFGAPAPTPAQPGGGGGQGVNPLGGTMAIDQVPFPSGGPGVGAPAPAAPHAGPPPGVGLEPPAQPGFGAPPPQAQGGGYGGPPQGMPPQQGYGGPQPQPGFGNPQAQGFQPHAHGHVGAMQPHGVPGMGMQPHGMTGPKGTVRNPLTVMILAFVTCGIYGIFAFWSMLNELKAYLQKDEIQPIFMFVPVLNLLLLIKLPEWVSEAKQRAGCQNPHSSGLILYWLFGIYFLPKDLNEVWEAGGPS